MIEILTDSVDQPNLNYTPSDTNLSNYLDDLIKDSNSLDKISSQRRAISNVPYPAEYKLKMSDLFDDDGKPSDYKIIKDHLFKEGRLEESTALKIINDATSLMRSEKNLVEVEQPVVIVGDIHGQYYDLIQILKHGGDIATTKFLFLGDYVDRGQFSIEVVLLLWYLKISYPSNVTLLRGNHECKHLTEHFSFKRECEIKYSLNVYEACIKSFYALPLACLVNKQFLCIHGGLSPDINSLEDIQKIHRECETPPFGPLCDLLWSDPALDYDEENKVNHMAFIPNAVRGCSYYYNYYAVSKFLRNNNLLSVIRAHEAQDVGVRFYRKNTKTNFPTLITLFSAPNYCDVYKNKGAIIKYENNSLNAKQYSWLSHPYWLPNFMDVFTWSLPFMAEKINEIILVLFKLCSSSSSSSDNKKDRKEILRAKVLAVGRLSLYFAKARAKSESAIHLNGVTPSSFTNLDSFSNTILANHLADANCILNENIKNRKLSIDEIKEFDKANECLPGQIVATVRVNTEKDLADQHNHPLDDLAIATKRPLKSPFSQNIFGTKSLSFLDPRRLKKSESTNTFRGDKSTKRKKDLIKKNF